MTGFASPVVGKFVESSTDMTANPDEFNIVGMIKTVEFFHEVEIFDFASGFVPTSFGPTVGPFGEDVDPEFRVGVDFAAFFAGVFDGGNHGGAFHADVGGVCVATEGDWLTGTIWLLFDDSIAAGSGVGEGAAICP